jgi:flagellar biogenesis protein FliO
MEEISNTPNPSMGNAMPKKSVNVWMIVAIIFVLISIGLGVYGFIAIRNQNNKINNLNSQVADLQNTKKALEDAAAAAAKAAVNTATNKTDNDLVNTSTTNYLESAVGAKNNQTFKIETVKINTAKTFATVGVGVLENGQRTSGFNVILKKVNNSWVVISEGQQSVPEEVTKYGIPNDFN